MYFMKTFLSVGSARTLQEPVGSMVNITIDKRHDNQKKLQIQEHCRSVRADVDLKPYLDSSAHRRELYVFFCPNYFPHVGGVERYTYGLTRELLKKGKNVLIITSSMKGTSRYSRDKDGAEIYRIPSVYVLSDRMPLMLPGNHWKRLDRILACYDSVRIVIQTMLYPMSLFALRYAKKRGYPYTIICHGSNYVCLRDSVVDKMEHCYEKWMLRQAQKAEAVFFAVSKSGQQWLEENFGIMTKGVLYNSLDSQVVESVCSSDTAPLFRGNKTASDTRIFAFVGRLISEKGIYQLLNAFNRLRAEGRNIALLVIGDGPEMEHMKKISGDQVFFLGYRSNSDTLSFLRESDCLCLPSDSEGGMPTVVLEAALCGCYIIVSPYGGSREFISSDRYGYLMEGNSEEDVYTAMKFFLENQERCGEVVKACRQHFLTDGFTWENTCKSLMSFFGDI